MRIAPARAAACVLAALLCPAVPALAEPAATGLFAPVARQLHIARLKLQSLPPAEVTPERVELLLATGQPDAAAAELKRLRGEPRAVALAKARVHLVRQDFAAAEPVLKAVAAQRDPDDRERQLLYAWRWAHDDAARVDTLTMGASLAPGTDAPLPDLLAAGRLAYELLRHARAESCFARAIERTIAERPEGTPGPAGPAEELRLAQRSAALAGMAQVLIKRRDYDGALARLTEALDARATSEALTVLVEALIRLGRTDEAITAAEWACRLNPYNDLAHYYRGNGYTRKNYTQLLAAGPRVFADSTGRAALARADALLAAGNRAGARRAYEAVSRANPAWVDAIVRLASLDFEDGKFASARDRANAALALCPEYGRAHAVLAKALESQRFAVDVHRAGYERRFAAAPMPDVTGIEMFVVNWKSLSPRHRKRVALSVAPWQRYLPVLAAGGLDYYIKPMYMLLSETPGQETLKDQRIGYDSRLWDDVRGCGGYHTITGIEDVERTIFDRYDTVLHELTHQVHGVLTYDQSREILELYRRAKERDERDHDSFLSRYAGGAVEEYFAEGANALYSKDRDAYDPRDVVHGRLVAKDPDLKALIERLMAQADVSASYPVAYTNAGDDRVYRGKVDEALPYFEKALELKPDEESALLSHARALDLGNRGPEMIAAANRAMHAHPASGAVLAQAAEAFWHGGLGLEAALTLLRDRRAGVRAEDRWLVDMEASRLAWVRGDAATALAAADSVLARQSDSPGGLRARASALALAGRWDEAFAEYERAVRLRTGLVDLRCDYAFDLVRAGRYEEATRQLDEARLLDEKEPTAEALRALVSLRQEDPVAAMRQAQQALKWGPWSDLARIVLGAAQRDVGVGDVAAATWAPVRERIARDAPHEWIYRQDLASWVPTHTLPAVERSLLEELSR
jgi:tetratricopeptide (TPR) repeat protein